jgi:hypothetical protein
MVSRDVIFDEKKAWNWGENDRSQGQAAVPYTFNVEFPVTIPGPTIDQNSETGADSSFGGALASPAVSIPSQGDSSSPPHTPISAGTTSNALGSATPDTPPVQWATPPSNASEDSDGAPRRYRTIPNLLDTTEEVLGFEYSGTCLVAVEEPRSVEEAMEDGCWRRAMQAEMKAIEENKTWEVCNLPVKHKAIGLKWVFKVKKDPDGNVVKHKARLVAKGYAQQQGVDFDEVFAPVARLETVRVLLALAAQRRWEVHHMDVKSAFLNGDLSEAVYVQQPPVSELVQRAKC